MGQDDKIIEIRKNNVTICTIKSKKKKEIVTDSLIRSLRGNSNCNFVYVPSEGASGGIIVMWKEGVVKMEDYLLGDFSLRIKFKNCSGNFVWHFTSVYGNLTMDTTDNIGKNFLILDFYMMAHGQLKEILLQFFLNPREMFLVVVQLVEIISEDLLVSMS